MSYASQTARYLENDIMSRRPEWLVPLLYEHLIASLERASVQMAASDFEGKAASFEKANAIVGELLASLDLEKGGEIAKQLSALYAFFTVELLNISRTMDRPALARLVAMAKELHGAWVAAAEEIAPRSARPAASREALQLA
jgi:flagellar secretion chaperone FliS